MIASEIITLSRDILSTNSGVLSDAKALEWLNIVYPIRILDVLKYQVDRNASMEIAKMNLVSVTGLVEGDNGYDGEYAFASDLVRPIRFEVSYDGVTFRPTRIYDLNENENSEVSGLNDTFSSEEPHVRFERNSYFLRPLPTTTVTNGIRVWYEMLEPALIVTDTPNIESSFHPLLAFDIASYELIRNAKLYSSEISVRIYREKSVLEEKFKTHLNDRMKRNFKIQPKLQNCA